MSNGVHITDHRSQIVNEGAVLVDVWGMFGGEEIKEKEFCYRRL